MNEKELPIGFRPKFDPEFKPEFKPEPVIISPPPRCGKTQLLKAIESLKPRCEKCGAKLDYCWYYGERFMYQKCSKCGELNRRKRGGLK